MQDSLKDPKLSKGRARVASQKQMN